MRPQRFFVIESIQSSVSESATSWLGWLREGEEGVDVLYQCRKKRLRNRDVSNIKFIERGTEMQPRIIPKIMDTYFFK